MVDDGWYAERGLAVQQATKELLFWDWIVVNESSQWILNELFKSSTQTKFIFWPTKVLSGAWKSSAANSYEKSRRRHL